MSTSKYPNQNALNQALDLYLGAMFLFVSECLDEQSIREFLRLLSDDDLRNEMEVKDIADLIKRYWSKSFKEKFKIIDRYDIIRYYDARSVTSLIVEGRNRVSHQRLQELDPEFTRAQLFLIAEVLGQINMSVPQREVEDIRDKLFKDTAEQLVTIAVEAEKAKYEKSITKVETRLAAEKENNEELSKQIVDNAAKLDEKKGELEELSGRLVVAKLDGKEYEKRLNSTSKRLEKVQTEHTKCEEHLTTIMDQFASTEVERDDYKERLETVSKELAEAKMEWKVHEDSLKTRLENAVEDWGTSVESLAAMRKLFETATIGNPEVQIVFPPFGTDSAVRILDRRGTDKRNYLLGLLEQKQPTIIYVQSEEEIDRLLTVVGPEKAAVIGKHNEHTSEAEETEILEKLEKRELIAVVSNTTFSTLASAHCVEHFVFCHLVPGLDAFFERCEPAFTSEKKMYLHLIYNNEKDIEELNQWLAQKYPDKEALRESYIELQKLANANGGFVKLQEVYNALDIVELGIETGLVIFEELGFLERDRNGIITLFLSPMRRELEESDTYRTGVEVKKETADFHAFQLDHSIEQIWEKMLEALNVDSEQILPASSIHRMPLRVSETEGDYLKDAQTQPEQSTEVVEKDSVVSQATKGKARKKKPSIAERYTSETTETDRDAVAVKVAEIRINTAGSKPINWKTIREKLGLKEDEFHKVIRPSKGYRKAVIDRIKQLKSRPEGWEYSGKLEVLTGIKLSESELS